MNAISAWQSLAESKTRTILSALGILVASVAILLLVGIGRGVEKDVRSQVEELGANVLVVVPGRMAPGLGFNPNIGGASYLSEADAEGLRQVAGVRRVALMTFAGGGISAKVAGKRVEAFPFVVATTSDWFAMRPLEFAEGRAFSAEQELEPVCVLGSLAAKELFGEASALDKQVDINNRSYRVVAVAREKNADQTMFSMQSFANVVYIPYPRLAATEPRVQIDRIMVQSEPDVEPKSLVRRLEASLGKRLSRQQFSVLTQEDLLGLIYRVMGILSWLLIGLTSIGLFVGGVGVMVTMFMAVNERRREIGIRKVCGARRSDIFAQFLFEASALGVLGVSGGIVSSLIVGWALEAFTPIRTDLSASVILLAIGVGLGLGVVFGLVPAVRAAAKDPVVCLRDE